ncbi:helix-turn-helix domain-containing protein [Salinactinospora qingdaonensis]|uniref:Transposase putative helix-turn-helix domain-containing protein n=1 Tax=Salinactinospora qingdaonensis TaxID=702744 RepID=A0ABP7FLI2_9ACTN
MTYKRRACPPPEQAAPLGRTFGCVRLMWHTTLAQRHTAWHERGEQTSYARTDAALSRWKKTGELGFCPRCRRCRCGWSSRSPRPRGRGLWNRWQTARDLPSAVGDQAGNRCREAALVSGTVPSGTVGTPLVHHGEQVNGFFSYFPFGLARYREKHTSGNDESRVLPVALGSGGRHGPSPIRPRPTAP